MSDFINYALYPGVAALISGVILFFIGKWYATRKNKVQYIEYMVRRTGNLIRMVKGKIEVKVDDIPITNFGVIELTIYNRTNRDYVDIPFDVKCHRISEPKGHFPFIKVEYDEETEKCIDVPDKEPPDGNEARCIAKVLNRNGDKPILSFTIIIPDVDDVEVSVSTLFVGVKMKKIRGLQQMYPGGWNSLLGAFFGMAATFTGVYVEQAMGKTPLARLTSFVVTMVVMFSCIAVHAVVDNYRWRQKMKKRDS